MFVHYKLWARAVRIHVKRPALFFLPSARPCVFPRVSPPCAAAASPLVPACVCGANCKSMSLLIPTRDAALLWFGGMEGGGEEKKEGLEVAGPGSPEIRSASHPPTPRPHTHSHTPPSPPRPNVRDRPPSTQKPTTKTRFHDGLLHPFIFLIALPPFFFPCACFLCSFASRSEYPGGVYVRG